MTTYHNVQHELQYRYYHGFRDMERLNNPSKPTGFTYDVLDHQEELSATYEVDFRVMVQVNNTTGTIRNLRRLVTVNSRTDSEAGA